MTLDFHVETVLWYCCKLKTPIMVGVWVLEWNHGVMNEIRNIIDVHFQMLTVAYVANYIINGGCNHQEDECAQHATLNLADNQTQIYVNIFRLEAAKCILTWPPSLMSSVWWVSLQIDTYLCVFQLLHYSIWLVSHDWRQPQNGRLHRRTADRDQSKNLAHHKF